MSQSMGNLIAEVEAVSENNRLCREQEAKARPVREAALRLLKLKTCKDWYAIVAMYPELAMRHGDDGVLAGIDADSTKVADAYLEEHAEELK